MLLDRRQMGNTSTSPGRIILIFPPNPFFNHDAGAQVRQNALEVELIICSILAADDSFRISGWFEIPRRMDDFGHCSREER